MSGIRKSAPMQLRSSGRQLFVLLALLLAGVCHAEVVEFTLVIERQSVHIAGHGSATMMTINGQVPGPTLRWRLGDRVRVAVHNRMTVPSSIHWHGILLPNLQDGVPGLTTPQVPAGGVYSYEFPIRHVGTYWYHSHTALQEQAGLYGAIVIEPPVPPADYDRDYVLVLSDWTKEDPNEIFRLLKSGTEHLARQKNAMQNVQGALREGALGAMLQRALMRMPPMDISDVAYGAFLANGKLQDQLAAAPGERIRVRIINAAASTYFYLDLAEQPLHVIAADGVDVQPVDMERLLIAVAETYDIIVTIPPEGALELAATAQDGSGRTSLWLGTGPQHHAPKVPAPNLYQLHAGHRMAAEMPASAHHQHATPRPMPPYAQLLAREATTLPDITHEIDLRLTGDMERYVWSFNDRTLAAAELIRIHKGETLRVNLENTTMMHHPLHLHGHFFRVVNGAGDHAPFKHTVDVPPLSTQTIEFAANEAGEWFFHCHILYHQKAGMARVFSYSGTEPDPKLQSVRKALFSDPWSVWGKAHLLSAFIKGTVQASSARHGLLLQWLSGWHRVPGTEHEGTALHRYRPSRFYGSIIGVNYEDEELNGVFGGELVLPLNIWSRLWVDTEGEFRAELEPEFALTENIEFASAVEYDTAERWEGRAALHYTLNQTTALTLSWHSDYGPGAGITLRY